mmetsp:Transcript_12932/g.11064  ORF Transcript_12932/g.11064 Transcript_12932/m.11064 type:complete len:85 (-) Transcript_12932:285-539(-)
MRQRDETDVDGFGVVFQRFPNETYVKRKQEVAVVETIDMDELEFKRINKNAYRESLRHSVGIVDADYGYGGRNSNVRNTYQSGM